MPTLANGPTIETGPEMRKLAEQANMYLKRVVDEHPEHLPGRVHDDDVVGSLVEHLDDCVDGDALGPDLHGGLYHA